MIDAARQMQRVVPPSETSAIEEGYVKGCAPRVVHWATLRLWRLMLNRNFILILLGNVILGSAMPLLIVLGGLAGAWLAPQSWLATALPSIQMLAGIAVASPISMFMGRYGRRAGFFLGAAALIIGAALAIVAVYSMSFVLLCMAHIALGAALICVNFFRFAAAEAVSEAHRPQAISFTLAS
ncbi:MAG: hypothetical protein AAFQ13_13965, partial [Pseudomonadota bacterium]